MVAYSIMNWYIIPSSNVTKCFRFQVELEVFEKIGLLDWTQTHCLNYAERTQDDLKFGYWIADQFFKIWFNHSVTLTKQKVCLHAKGHHSPLTRIQEYFYPNRQLEETEYSFRAIVGFVQARRWALGGALVKPNSRRFSSLLLLLLLPFIPISPALIVVLSLLALSSISCPLLPFS